VKFFGLAFLFASSVSATALAAPTCPQYVPFPFFSISNIIDLGDGSHIVGKNIDCAKIGVGAQLITKIQRLLGTQIEMPKRLRFNMVDVFDNAFHFSGDSSLNVPVQLFSGEYKKHPVHTHPVWAHEYGHAILNTSIESALSGWRSALRLNSRSSSKSIEQDPMAQVFQTLLMGYHEFFADVVAVLYTGEGDSVSKSLYFTGIQANPEGKPSVCPNSFPECRSSNKVKLKNSMAVVTASRSFLDRRNQLPAWKGVHPLDGHNLFAPARFHIWKYYLSNPAFRAKKAEMAKVVIEATLFDLNRRFERMSRGGYISQDSFVREISDVYRINEEYIRVLDAAFEKHGM
jgi:hypothetical protein